MWHLIVPLCLLVAKQRKSTRRVSLHFGPHLLMMHEWLAYLYALHVTVHFTPLYITYLPLLYYTERVFCESNNFPHDQIFAWRNSIDLCTLLNALDYLDFPGHVISIMPTRNHIFLNNNWHCTSSHSTWPVPRLSHYSFFRKRNSNFSSRFKKWRSAAVPTFPCSYF